MQQPANNLPDLIKQINEIASYPNRTKGRWTDAQIFYHLAAAFEASIDSLAKSRYPRAVRWMMRPFRWVVISKYLPPRIPIPAKELEPPADAVLAEQHPRLIAAIERYEQYDGPLQDHPVLGRLIREEWTEFHLRHCCHHLNFIVIDKAESEV